MRPWGMANEVKPPPTVTATIAPTIDFSQFDFYLQVLFALKSYVFPIMIILGVAGNTMSLLVAVKPSNREMSTCCYMGCLAVIDSAVLLDLMAYLIFIEWNLGLGVVNRVMVHRVNYFLVEFLGQLSGWILSAMTVDRFIAIRFPMKAQTFCSVKRAKRVVFGLTVTIGILNTNIIFTYQVKKDPVFGLERYVEDFSPAPIVETIVSLWELLSGTVIPFAVIIVFNSLIICTVNSAAHLRHLMSDPQGTKKVKSKRVKAEVRLTRMLLFVSVAYLVCSVPGRIYLLAQTGSFNDQNPEWFISFNVGYWSGSIGWYMNYAINFYLYCIAGGRKFRRDVLEILCHCVGSSEHKTSTSAACGSSTGKIRMAVKGCASCASH